LFLIHHTNTIGEFGAGGGPGGVCFHVQGKKKDSKANRTGGGCPGAQKTPTFRVTRDCGLGFFTTTNKNVNCLFLKEKGVGGEKTKTAPGRKKYVQ